MLRREEMRVDDGCRRRQFLLRQVMVGDDGLSTEVAGVRDGGVGGDPCVAGDDEADALCDKLVYAWTV
jgi:hypothetical protein